MQSRHAQQSVPPRTGFSLVEILIVIGIIGLLVATLVVAIGPSLESARINATRTTIAQIDAAIQARVEAIAKLDVRVEAKKLAALTTSLDQDEAEFLLRKHLYRQALAQRPEDLLGFNLSKDDAADSTSECDDAPYAQDWMGATSSDDDRLTSAEVFFLAITEGGTLRVLPKDWTSMSLGAVTGGKSYQVPTLDVDSINPRHVGDLDNDGRPEFIDEWNNPIQFYSFPTRLIRPSGNGGSISLSNATVLMQGLPTDTSASGPLVQDPLDPIGDRRAVFDSGLTVNYFRNSSGGTESVSVSSFDEPAYHTRATYYAPLLVSAGPDGELGLGLPASTTTSERLCEVLDATVITDNITNRQQ